VSELIIGLTLVAAGTSLPEAATSVVAAIRGERDIAVGNAVGSCLFNLMGVLGITALVAPAGIAVPPAALRVDLPVMIAVAFACLPVFFTGHRIARWEGALFLAYFAAYVIYLLLSATQSSVQRTFAVAMVGFVIPLTCVTLAVAVLRSLPARR
jgi:cation:H+ antiporter